MRTTIQTSDYLAHYGVKGMKYYEHKFGKWQKQAQYANGQDDPDKSDSNKQGSVLAAYAIGVGTIIGVEAIRQLSKKGAEAIKKALNDSGARKLEAKNDARIEAAPVDKKTGFHLKTWEFSDKEDIAAVNPGFKNSEKDTKNNCALCTATYDLRKRGYDVTALKTDEPISRMKWAEWYPKAKTVQMSAADEQGNRNVKNIHKNAMDYMSKMPDGERGVIGVAWAYGNVGHAMVYEKNNGKARIIDAQSGKIYDDPMKIISKTRAVSFSRLDNVAFDPKKIKEVAR